jgi:hypothetical protein
MMADFLSLECLGNLTLLIIQEDTYWSSTSKSGGVLKLKDHLEAGPMGALLSLAPMYVSPKAATGIKFL